MEPIIDQNYEYDFSDKIISEEEAQKVYSLQKEFLASYARTKDTMTVEEWLPSEMQKQLPEKSSEEIEAISNEIIDNLRITEKKKESLQEAIASGRSKESWFASSIQESTSYLSAQESAKYLQGLDDAVKQANEAMYDTITTKAGMPNMNMNLDGFIAEQHHANTYNMKAQATGSDLHAEVLKPKPGETYAKNSVDIVIKDSSGKIVSRYQAKYGATAEDTIRMIKEGDYRGQQLIVPEDQVEAVQKAFPDRKVSSTIGSGKTKSEPLSKAEAKKKQEEAQKGNWLDVSWNEYSAKDIAIGIAKNAGIATLQGAAVGVGMNVASKLIQGEPIDGEEVVETAITSGADFGVKTATAGALKAASEKGILTIIPKGTNSNVITGIAFTAIENVKVLGKVATGELTVKEGLDVCQQTTAACVAGMAASAKGAAIGASVGAVLGPIGSAIGGAVGGMIGYIAGSKAAQTLVKGVQMVRDTAKSFVKSAVEGVKSFVGGVVQGVGNFVSGIFGGGGGGGCLARGTLITMADNTRKPVEDIQRGDVVKIFNHYTGCVDDEIIIANVHDNSSAILCKTITLMFDDGRSIKLAISHVLFDITEKKYVLIDDENARDYIGHEFAVLENEVIKSASLCDVTIANEQIDYYAPMSKHHLDVFAEGILTMPPTGITVNMFPLNADMTYEMSILKETGLTPYERVKRIITKEEYEMLPIKYIEAILKFNKVGMHGLVDAMTLFREQAIYSEFMINAV